MFTVESAVRLPAPLPRVWRVISEVDRFRFWHGLVVMKPHPTMPRKPYVHFRKHPTIGGDADIVRFEPQTVFAWRLKLGPIFTWQEEYHLERFEAGTQVTLRVQVRGLFSLLMKILPKARMRASLETSGISLGRYLAQTLSQRPGQPSETRKR